MSSELTFCLHGGYLVSRERMAELYQQFRPGQAMEADFDGNAIILSPYDMNLEEEVWLLAGRCKEIDCIEVYTPDVSDQRVMDAYGLNWCHLRKRGVTYIEQPKLFVFLSQIEVIQPAHR